MSPLDVLVRIQSVACHKKAEEIGGAEPYLWTVFFKIDGDTASVDDSLTLQGMATVFIPPASRGDLHGDQMRAGDVVDVPALIGEYRTTLKPILLTTPFLDHTHMAGGIGCVVALLEHDFSDEYEVARAYISLVTAVQDSLNALMPTLNFSTREIKAEASQSMHQHIRAALAHVVDASTSRWEDLQSWRNDDDVIGYGMWYWEAGDLAAHTEGISFHQGWNTNGEWEVKGRVTAD